MKTGSLGFTIVELLIVVVVIAILAAVTIVSYNGITKQANISAQEADVKAILDAQDAYRIIHGQTFSNESEAREAGLANASGKLSWWPSEVEPLDFASLTSTTPRGKYMLMHETSTLSSYWVNGMEYTDVSNEVFEIYYWDYSQSSWVVRWNQWIGFDKDIQKGNPIQWRLKNVTDNESPCTASTLEECRYNPSN